MEDIALQDIQYSLAAVPRRKYISPNIVKAFTIGKRTPSLHGHYISQNSRQDDSTRMKEEPDQKPG